jgi:CRISPR-associated protein Csm1
MKGAELSAVEEKNAKNYENEISEKNAFSLMGFALSWKTDMEFDMVLDLKTRFLDLMKAEKLPKSLIGNISTFDEQRKFQIKKKKNESWQWVMAYQLARSAKQQNNMDVEKLIDEIKVSVFTDSYKNAKHKFKYKFIELLNLAARWAELEYRTIEKKINIIKQ